MSFKSCCVQNCFARHGHGVPLHRFPNPSTDQERFQVWVHKIGGEVAILEQSFVFKNRRICHRHFNQIYDGSKNRLSKIAVPDNTNVEVPISDGVPSNSHSLLLESLVQDVSSTSEDSNVPMSTQKENFIALTTTSSRHLESVENMEYGASSSICNSNGSKTPLRKYELSSRTELLRKKRAPELESDCSGVQSPPKQKKMVDERTLSEEKLKLIQLQREILEKEIEHKTKISELELEDKIKENKFKEAMRQKELFLMDVKIKKEHFFQKFKVVKK